MASSSQFNRPAGLNLLYTEVAGVEATIIDNEFPCVLDYYILADRTSFLAKQFQRVLCA